MKRFLILCLLGLSTLSVAQVPDLYSGKDYKIVDGIVKRTYDGDTPGIKFAGVDTITTCRVLYFDTPEDNVWYVTRKQPGGKAATDTAHAILINKAVRVGVFGKDRYNRPLVIIWVDGVRFDELMLKKGMAWYLPLSNSVSVPARLQLKGGIAISKQAQTNQLGVFNKKVYASRALLPATWRVKYKR